MAKAKESVTALTISVKRGNTLPLNKRKKKISVFNVVSQNLGRREEQMASSSIRRGLDSILGQNFPLEKVVRHGNRLSREEMESPS